jgi:crotonobetainyl-CoA:carnitine CoA-transferase CaiB-like acyl-CoA transferase
MKLQGIKVIDLSVFLPGPYLTLALCDHGAEVIKVEASGGDEGRKIGLSDGEETVFFRNFNRGKKSIALDLKQDGDRERLLKLCEDADVFVESFRPGVMQRLGLDYDTIKAINPGIVYCSISAFGQQGSRRGKPAHDLAVQAEAGVLSVSLGQDDLPAIPAVPLADVLSGLQGLAGVLMALLRRQTTGEGDYIDIAMLDSVLSASGNIVGPVFAQGRQPVAKHERTTGGSAFYRIYKTADGHIALGGQEKKFVHALLEALERPDLIDAVLSGPGPHQKGVADFLERTFAEHGNAYWNARLTELDVCFGEVRTLTAAFADPASAERGILIRDEAGRIHIGSPIRFRHEPARPVLAAPALSQHAEAILGRPSGRQ